MQRKRVRHVLMLSTLLIFASIYYSYFYSSYFYLSGEKYISHSRNSRLPASFSLRSAEECSCHKLDTVRVDRLSSSARAGASLYNITVHRKKRLNTKRSRIVSAYTVTDEQLENAILTCNTFKELRRGPNQKVFQITSDLFFPTSNTFYLSFNSLP